MKKPTIPPKPQGRPSYDRLILEMLQHIAGLLEGPMCHSCGSRGDVWRNGYAPPLCKTCREME